MGRLCLMALHRIRSSGTAVKSAARLIAFVMLVLACNSVWSQDLLDESVRAQMLMHGDGRIAHIETEYNNLFITKEESLLTLSTRFKGDHAIDSMVNLKDPDDMPVPYTRMMSAGVLYPEATRRVLMVGLGAGSISTYLGRAMPDVTID